VACRGGRQAVARACPETWTVIWLTALFVGYTALYIFLIRKKQNQIVSWVLRRAKVQRPDKMTLYAKQFLPIVWFLSFIALAWFVIAVRGEQDSNLAQGSAGLGAFGLVFLVFLQKVVFPSGGIHGPEELLMDRFDEKQTVSVTDTTGVLLKALDIPSHFTGRIRAVSLHDTKMYMLPDLKPVIIPNSVMVKMVVVNHDRSRFHFHRIPLADTSIDMTRLVGTIAKQLVTLNQKDETWYNNIFGTATADKIANEETPVRVGWTKAGPELLLPVRNHRDAVAAEHLLIAGNIIRPRNHPFQFHLDQAVYTPVWPLPQQQQAPIINGELDATSPGHAAPDTSPSPA
jgi:hypothetical protein